MIFFSEILFVATMPPYNDNGSEINQLNSSMENESNSTYMMAKRDPLYIVVPMTIMYSVIFVTGVIGNSITCMVIAKHKYMHTATNYYLFSLAVSDLILLVSGLPQEMWSIWSKWVETRKTCFPANEILNGPTSRQAA